MQNTTCNQPETETHLTFLTIGLRCLKLLLLLVLTFVPLTASAQNEKPIEPNSTAPNNIKDTSKVGGSAPAVNTRASQSLIDTRFAEDPRLLKILGPYRAPVRALEVVIGRLDGNLQKGGIGAGSLGNFVTDGLRAEASRSLRRQVQLTVTNSGGLRKNTIGEGKLRVRDIYELLPFENALIQIDLTGDQVLKLLAAVVANRDAQSGARITYRIGQDKRPELLSVKLVDPKGREIAIDPKAIYSIVTIDYLYGLGSGRYSILREGKNMKPLGITIREALLRYVKSQSAARRPVRAKLDDRFIEANPTHSKDTIPQ
jgi:2',3'-cyclic-nucleotide 2'-phosphodiesterase (5'-nucleotidase family)